MKINAIEQKHKGCGGSLVIVYSEREGLFFACKECLANWSSNGKIERPEDFENVEKEKTITLKSSK